MENRNRGAERDKPSRVCGRRRSRRSTDRGSILRGPHGPCPLPSSVRAALTSPAPAPQTSPAPLPPGPQTWRRFTTLLIRNGRTCPPLEPTSQQGDPLAPEEDGAALLCLPRAGRTDNRRFPSCSDPRDGARTPLGLLVSPQFLPLMVPGSMAGHNGTNVGLDTC